MALHEFVRAHPVHEILAAIPEGEDHVWVAIIDRTQHLIGNETRHSVHQLGALAKPLFERIAVLRRDIDTISDSYHCVISLCSDDTRAVAQTLVCDYEPCRITDREVFPSPSGRGQGEGLAASCFSTLP